MELQTPALQTLALQRLLKSIPINSTTRSVLDEYFANYVQPSAIDKYLEIRGLYHVFFRQEDPHEIQYRSDDIYLIKSFATEHAATNWVIEHGKDIVSEQEENYGKPIVITIIYFDNKGDYYMGEDPSHMYLISTKKYPTFAFSAEGYRMLLREHRNTFNYNYQDEIIPYWITYFRGDASVIKGLSYDDLLDIQDYMRFNETEKQRQIADFMKFEQNPNAYIKKQKKEFKNEYNYF